MLCNISRDLTNQRGDFTTFLNTEKRVEIWCAEEYFPVFSSRVFSTLSCVLISLIVSITKFSIVIGSPRNYLSRNRCAVTWVSNYRCPIWTFCNWIPTFTSITRVLMVSFAMFPTALTLMKSVTDVFAQKNFSKDTFILKFVIDTVK